MSYAFCLQDLTTIGGPVGNPSPSIVQAADSFLDLSGFQDIVVWADIKYVTFTAGTALSLFIETAPIADEFLFDAGPMINMATGGAGSLLLASNSVLINKVLLSAATNPLARWVRWRVLPSGNMTTAWSLTFRLWVCASTPGMR